MAKVSKQVNTLTFEDMYRVSEWLKKHKGELVTQRPTREVVASRVEADLGITVTKHQVRRYARAAGVVWRPTLAGRTRGRKCGPDPVALQVWALMREYQERMMPQFEEYLVSQGLTKDVLDHMWNELQGK